MSLEGKLRMEYIEGTVEYMLLSRLVWIDPDGKRWELNPGQISDGHSIPWYLRSIGGSPFATKYPKSSWFHDDWCRTGIIPRKEADQNYILIMKEEGANKFQQKRNWLGVRIGAFGKWVGGLFKRKKKEDEEDNSTD